LKVFSNVKIAMQCFENFGGGNAPNASPRLRAWYQRVASSWNDCRSGKFSGWTQFNGQSME